MPKTEEPMSPVVQKKPAVGKFYLVGAGVASMAAAVFLMGVHGAARADPMISGRYQSRCGTGA